MQLKITIFFAFCLLWVACSKETPQDKIELKLNRLQRSLQKASNYSAEILCGELTGDTKLECLAKKAKNRVVEGKDAIMDKSRELKNTVDSE